MYEQLRVIKFLKKHFGEKWANRVKRKFRLCGSNKTPGAVIFWQINRGNNISIYSPIAIFESEKAAIIITICNPTFIWITAGGDKGLTYDKCKVLKGFDGTLFPDQRKVL